MQTEPVGACPVCGDARRETLHDGLVDRLYGAAGRWRLQRCVACGAAYLDPRPTPEDIGAAYVAYYTHEPTPDAPAGAARHLWRRLRNGYLNARYGCALAPASRLGRVLVPLLPPKRAAADRHIRGLVRTQAGASVLDVGCGDGEFLLAMRAAGWVVQGLETDPRAAQRARERGLNVREGALELGAFPSRSFHAVTLSHVLEHVHDPIQTLRACREIVRDDGVLWLATPNLESPGHTLFGSDWRGLEPPRHLVLFTAGALRHALDRAGFRLISMQRPAPAAWVYRASEALGQRAPVGRATLLLADARSALDHARGEELVAVAEPSV